MNEKLKPCPFCGNSDIYLAGYSVYWCECKNCKAETGAHNTKESAIESWNMRVEEEDECK